MSSTSRTRVLVVCLGNICRSPLGEYLLRYRLDDVLGQGHGIDVVSAGTYSGHHGEPMHRGSARELSVRGIDASTFRATHLTPALVRDAALLLGAEAEHVEAMVDLDPSATPRAFTILEFAQLSAHLDSAALAAASPAERMVELVSAAHDLRQHHVSGGQWSRLGVDDPYGMPQSEFQRCAEVIDQAAAAVVGLIAGR